MYPIHLLKLYHLGELRESTIIFQFWRSIKWNWPSPRSSYPQMKSWTRASLCKQHWQLLQAFAMVCWLFGTQFNIEWWKGHVGGLEGFWWHTAWHGQDHWLWYSILPLSWSYCGHIEVWIWSITNKVIEDMLCSYRTNLGRAMTISLHCLFVFFHIWFKEII